MAAFRFRRWSRKRYAAFVSRQRAFTMGTLRSNVVDRLLKKGVCAVSAAAVGTTGFFTGEAGAEQTPADGEAAWLFAGVRSGFAGCQGVACAVARIVSFRSDSPAAAVFRCRYTKSSIDKGGKFPVFKPELSAFLFL